MFKSQMGMSPFSTRPFSYIYIVASFLNIGHESGIKCISSSWPGEYLVPTRLIYYAWPREYIIGYSYSLFKIQQHTDFV